MRLLALDTASALCSAALWEEGRIATREVPTPREHAQLLLPMIDSLLAEAGWSLDSLDAIAFGRGPGSFTGLRVAASIAHGLAFGADRPLLPVSDLRALALQAQRLAARPAGPLRIACCMDARMGEVYAAAYDLAAGEALPPEAPERVLKPAAFRPDGAPPDLRIGRGFAAYATELAPLGARGGPVFADAEPCAQDVARLAAVLWTTGALPPAEAAQPVYLRDDVARPASS